jgi:hypothetical protein
VSGVPLSVDDHEILAMLKKLGDNPKSDLQYEKIRNPVTKKMTGVFIGNRYIYIEPLPADKFLPRSSFCAGIQCRIYHFGQPKPPKRKYHTCWSSDHPTSKCTDQAKFAFNQVTPRVMNNAHLTLKNVRILILCSMVMKMFCLTFTYVKSLSLEKITTLLSRHSNV